MTDAYKKAGVDIDSGNQFVKNIKAYTESTRRQGVMGAIGGFGGFFALDTAKYKNPVLVSGTDGVGTKLKIAIDMGLIDTVGIDLVAMCVNDIAVSGAEPLFFLDYFAMGKLEPERHAAIVKGVAHACATCNCALIGGETAEMPGMYAGDDFDLAGFAVGVVDKDKIIDGHTIRLGDALVGIASSGFHSNGYSLIRHVLAERNLDIKATVGSFDRPLGELLLTPTKLYSPLVMRLKESFTLKGLAHITGGGLTENIPRVLPSAVQATIDMNAWERPPLMRYIQEVGTIDEDEMRRVFNCGVGLVMVVPTDEAEAVVSAARQFGEEATVIGSIEKRTGAPIVFK